MKKNFLFVPALIFSIALTSCGNSDIADVSQTENISVMTESAAAENTAEEPSGNSIASAELEVCFGSRGEPFTLHLYDNETAAAIAKHVGTASWQLPIYHYDDYDNWEVMQYYDIPARYEIPSIAETITAEKAGEVYYSEPNRIILFFGDAEVSGEYTRVGYFDCTEEFVSAVENNPVLEGWGNKIVLIKTAE
ncbi:MAG: cyclophilin-like fold protein [Ruminococcus sp.]|nr:cyclophilin-like fold protein [Ruminococcus sp.]MCM1381613.1 cyclophilin-like fold protein [Muribaculaceae bacterium]MCM1480394.1 cyclophilin-like fold protein [Muribaculaceae bacterium]